MTDDPRAEVAYGRRGRVRRRHSRRAARRWFVHAPTKIDTVPTYSARGARQSDGPSKCPNNNPESTSGGASVGRLRVTLVVSHSSMRYDGSSGGPNAGTFFVHAPVPFRFYVWAAVVADGEVQAMDFAPNSGWLETVP